MESDGIWDTWRTYKETGDLEARNALIVHYSWLVRATACKVGAGLPAFVELDDLISYGQFGLIEAINAFDVERNIKFKTFAIPRVRGSILDELRKIDWVPRGVRSRVRDVEKVRSELQAELGRDARPEEMANRLEISLQDFWDLENQANSALVSGIDEVHKTAEGVDRSTVADITWDVDANPEDIFSTAEVTDRVAEAISHMPERFKTILVLYYIQEMTLAEIGEVLGVTESRVCQLQSKILLFLRESLGQGALSAA